MYEFSARLQEANVLGLSNTDAAVNSFGARRGIELQMLKAYHGQRYDISLQPMYTDSYVRARASSSPLSCAGRGLPQNYRLQSEMPSEAGGSGNVQGRRHIQVPGRVTKRTPF